MLGLKLNHISKKVPRRKNIIDPFVERMNYSVLEFFSYQCFYTTLIWFSPFLPVYFIYNSARYAICDIPTDT